MSRAETKAPAPESATTAAKTSAGGSGATSDISTALLDLLRKLNAEVPPAPALQGKALDAKKSFQAISIDLRTLADRS